MQYLRVNTLKISPQNLRDRLESKGMVLEDTYLDYMFKIVESPFSPGCTPEYLFGYYYLQTVSSTVPPIVLDPSSEDMVLDMCAAPGGKTTHMAQLMDNQGIIVANDIRRERLRSLSSNIHRLGIKNVLILNMDALKLDRLQVHYDKILLDAPCTGNPVKGRSREITKEDIEYCSRRQKGMLDVGLNILKVGGELVYSTCSQEVEENEEVVQYILDRREDVQLVDITYFIEVAKGVNIREGGVKGTLRIHPPDEPFFIAKFKKVK
ncbi:NOL1/NOP2/sun family putative RNA methylase [Methanothermococcus sp. SCGC AD-155-E23]|nr:NOL1/NOP2/sun family putative RNA methylase [Methanothermococcus sp. SCGC AD-155-E23]